MTTEAEFESSDLLGAPKAIAKSPWVVMKFGGTSVSSADNWQVIASLVQHRLDAGLKPVIEPMRGMRGAVELDLFGVVRSTQHITFSDTHVKCHGLLTMEAKKHLERLARQRCVGANGKSTG